MLEILQFIFQDFAHYLGTLGLIIIISACIADIGKAFVRDYCPKTYIFTNDNETNQTITEKNLDE